MKHLPFSFLAFCVGFSAYAQVPSYVPTDGLIAWYSFDSNLDDAGPSDYDGQSESFGFGEDVMGQAESALRLELGEYVSLGMADKLLNNGLDTVSISFWSKPDEGGLTTVSKYVNFEPEQSSWMMFDYESAGARALGNGFDGDDAAWFSNCPNVTSEWSHVAANFTPGRVSLWVNGEFICETGVPNSNVTDPQPILVGRSNCDGDYCNDASGLIDNLGFWNRSLSPEEIATLFQSQENPSIAGCMDETACNFDEASTLEDGSCEYGCNYCGTGTTWDAEMHLCLPEMECDSLYNPDVDFDGFIGLTDLLAILIHYNNEWPPWECGDPLEYQGYDYETVQIGEQCWFAENSRYLPDVSPSQLGNEDDDEAHAYVIGYQGTATVEAMATDNYQTYGALYSFLAVQTWDLCPTGWHIGSSSEWNSLVEIAGGTELAASVLKATSAWQDETEETDALGFSVLPGGYRHFAGGGNFYELGQTALFWSSDGMRADFVSNSTSVHLTWGGIQWDGNSVRCVKDAE